MTTTPFNLVTAAMNALRSRRHLGADSAEEAVAQLLTVQSGLHEWNIILTAWDPKFASLFAPIDRLVTMLIGNLERDVRTQRGCTCNCSDSKHTFYGCEAESPDGRMGYCNCSWTGLPTGTGMRSGPSPSRAEVEEKIAHSRHA